MAEGDLKWKYNAGSQIASGIIVGSDGVIYFGDRYDGIFALNSDGTLKWKYNTPSTRIESGTALSNDESVVYFGGNNSEIYAIYTATGNLKWVYDTSPTSYIQSGILVDSNDNIYYGCGDGIAASLTYAGNLRWEVKDTTENYAGLLIQGSYLYAAAYSGLHKLQLSNGAEIWNHYDSQSGDGTGISVDNGGTICYGGNGYFYGVNPSDGSEKWKYAIGNYGCTANAVGSNGNIWFVDCNGANTKLIVLDSDGNLVWDYNIPNWVGSGVGTSGLALDANNRAYVGCYDNKLYAINSSGVLDWTYTTGDKVLSGIAFNSAQDTVYFGSDDGYLYAIEIKECGKIAVGDKVFLLPIGNFFGDIVALKSDVFATSDKAFLASLDEKKDLKLAFKSCTAAVNDKVICLPIEGMKENIVALR